MIDNMEPKNCWSFLQITPSAVIIDVRTTIEHSFIGHPLGAIHVAWKEFPSMTLNIDFLQQIEAIVKQKSTPILLLCRSGVRSLAAAKILEQAGYQHLINITEGFEGDLDDQQHRGNINGWRFHNLPWIQS